MFETGQTPRDITRRETAVSCLVILAAWFGFRLYAYADNWLHIMSLLPQEGFDWVAFPPEYLRDHFWKAMYYLRQVPPLPQFVLGTTIHAAGWPFSLPWISFLLSVMTLFSALLMRAIMLRSGFSHFISTLLALLWCLSTDNIHYEIDAYPKAMYELMTSGFLVASLWALLAFMQSKKTRLFVAFALLTTLAVMTRSTLSAFFIIPIFIGLLCGRTSTLLLGGTALLFQLLLAGKNYAAYGDFHLETSSFAPANFMASVITSGHVADLEAFVRQSGREDICIQHLDNSNIDGSNNASAYCRQVLLDAQAADAKLAENIGLPVEAFSYGSRTLHELFLPAKTLYADFLLARPDILMDILTGAYRLFWQPASNDITPLLASQHDAGFILLTAITDLIRCVNIAAIHLWCLPTLTLLAWRYARQRKITQADIPFLYASLSFLYVALVSSVADYSENNRYRFAVEPLIWLMPFLAWRYLVQKTNQQHA